MSGKKKRERRDRARMEKGLKPRTTVEERRQRESNVRTPSKTEEMSRDEAVFTRHGLILPPQATGGLRLVRVRRR